MIPSFILRQELPALIEGLRAEYTVFVPERRGEHRNWARLSPTGPLEPANWAMGEPRTVEPLKAFVFAGRERVAVDFLDALPPAPGKAAVVGAKACDLRGLAILDKVFLEGEYIDPHYERRRRGTLVVSADCTSAGETCFCSALHGRPFPERGFDLNLSQTSGGFVAEAGSDRGKAVLGHFTLRGATPEEIEEREERRRKVTEEVRAKVRSSGMPDLDELEGVVEKGYQAPLWNEEALRCVECGACNAICPTCHCFLLADRTNAGHLARLRLWDSCLIKDFARVAGGANPRPRLAMRLRNRFEKKFDFFPKTSGLYACTGCGRCISACPGRIDIRKILRGLTEHVSQREPVPTG